jgi:hypothetical protein
MAISCQGIRGITDLSIAVSLEDEVLGVLGVLEGSKLSALLASFGNSGVATEVLGKESFIVTASNPHSRKSLIIDWLFCK